MTKLLRVLLWVAMLLPFVFLCWLNCKANLKKPNRHKQFLMPLAALILCVLAIMLLTKIYDFVIHMFTNAGNWSQAISLWILEKWPDMERISNFFAELGARMNKLFGSLNLEFWAFYVANALIFLAYVILKKPIVLFMQGLFQDGNLFQKIAGLFYEYDEETGAWHLQPKFCQARTFLKTLYITAVVLGAAGVLISSWLYGHSLLHAIYYPVFSVIILGELYFMLDGLTKKELNEQDQLDGEKDEAERISNYSTMRDILRKLFPDKLSAENTTISVAHPATTTVDELLNELEASDAVAEEAYGRFMRTKCRAGMEIDFNYFLSGKQLLNGQSVLFNNPFYYDLIPYIFFPMNRALLHHKKVLIVLGRHGTEESVKTWCQDGLTAVTNIPSMWNVGVLGQESQELQVGIVTRSSVHDLKMHEANQEFFDDVEFVVLIEPSRLVTTAQVGLNSLVRHCRRKPKQITFCSADKNCDGLLDALSHILMVSLREVSATNHHKGASSYMIWEADGEHLQHRMLPNLSRYLGMGTELSFAALKNQIPHADWYGGEAFPVVDVNWIAQQYYYDLLNYANLPASQETMDRVFRVYPDMWSAPMADCQYMTVEDEAFNMFEVKRDFSTRAKDQGFINVLTSEYLLKDYMSGNDSIFNADPKAIPYITADYARTPRNVVLRLCLRMSIGLVTEDDICRDLVLIDRDPTNPIESLWNEICMNCGHMGSADASDGRKVLRCHTAGEDEVFNSDVLIRKRRFNMNSGKMENMYTITNGRFIRLLLSSLRPAEYVAEDERGEHQYLGTELQGHIYQKYLPGQFFTFSGKYYEMLRVTSEGQVLVRRASEHINGRPSYRQVRNYTICNPVDSQVMGECRDMGAIRIARQYADIRVETPAYWKMNRYNDFSSGIRVGINGVPMRVYNHKALLRIDLNPQEALPEGTVSTLVLLINEVLRSLLAENQDYLVAVSAGDAQIPTTYSLQGEGEFQPQPNSIYLIEDSQMDIGLLDAVERNLNRILAIICDYLQWHEESLIADEQQPEAPAEDAPEAEEPTVEGTGEKPGLFKRIIRAIVNFFKKIGRFFKKIFTAIANFFRKLFKRKPKDPEVADIPVDEQSAEPVEEAPAEEATEATVGETEEVQQDNQEVPREEIEPEDAPPEEAEPTAEEAPVSEGDTADAQGAMMSLFSTAEPMALEADTAEAPADDNLDDVPVETAPGSDGDTVDFEPEEVIDPEGVTVSVPIRRLPYKERYYLRYGSEELAQTLQLTAVKDLLLSLGYGNNNSLTQARKGLDAAKMVERTFVPNREGIHYCDFCGCEISGMDYDVLADGRERCPACSRTAVKSLEEFVQLHDVVLRNMKMFYGIKINAPVHVQMVNSKKLHKRLKQTFIPTDKSDGRILGVAIKDGSGYSILVENGAPRLQSTLTMVHEMTHIWQYLNWDTKKIKKAYGKDELEVYEGMSKWVEIQYAYLMGEPATGKREEMITELRDDPYGRGFVKYRKKYPISEGTRLKGNTPFDNVQKPL